MFHIIMAELQEILHSNAQILVQMQYKDLAKAFNEMLDEHLSRLEESIAKRDAVKYYTRQEVMQIFSVASSTLWRWQRNGYLVPRMIGGQSRYMSTDIQKIMEGNS